MALPYSITESTSKIGLYMEDMGKIRTYSAEWHLATKINMTSYHEEFERLKKAIDSVELKCYTAFISVKSDCFIQIDHLRSIFDEMNEYNMDWFMENKNHSRSRRGLINIVGSLMKSIFGTLDSEDAEIYLAKFIELENHNLLQMQFAEEQTTLIQSALNNMNQSIVLQTARIEKYFQIATEYMNDHIRVRSCLTDTIQYIFMSLFAFQTKQKLVIEAISLSQNNPNSPQLLPPKIFYDELKKILALISARNLDLPIQLNKNSMAMFYHISTAEAAFIDNQLIINFKIPLVHSMHCIQMNTPYTNQLVFLIA